jgi:predicted RNA binding protein YcfA (HicA-like mRNA interferase family)
VNFSTTTRKLWFLLPREHLSILNSYNIPQIWNLDKPLHLLCNQKIMVCNRTPSFPQKVPMLTNSRDIKRRLEKEGWVLERVTGSHHVFKHPQTSDTVVLPHPKKDLGPGLVRAIYRQAKWKRD